jgi:putative oxidoreductase
VSDPHAVDTALLVIRVALGVVFLAHGYNHVFGGGKIAGTARWFESLGMRPGRLHAWTASLTELGAGVLLLLGLLTPLACAGIVGTMVVALVTNHLRNGFFIFRPGEGYEYVMTLTLVAIGLAGVGGGEWSLDNALGIFQPGGWAGLAIAVLAGGGGAAGLLVTFWRPSPATKE